VTKLIGDGRPWSSPPDKVHAGGMATLVNAGNGFRHMIGWDWGMGMGNAGLVVPPAVCPRQDSNLRTLFRRPEQYR
jgi:hypothetical protein